MAARFWVGGAGTWDASTTTNWAATSGGAGGQSVPGSADTVTFDANSGGGTVTVNTNFSVTSLTMGAFTGTLDFATNNNSPTMGNFANTGTGTRTLNMGSGTWTITGTTGTSWSQATTTNLTFNAGTSTVLFSAVAVGSRAMQWGSVTFNNVSVVNASRDQYLLDWTNGNAPTFANLTLTNVAGLRLSAGVTHTVTGTFTFDGQANTPALILTSGGAATLSLASANTWDWIVAQNITKSGAGSLTLNNSYSAGGLTSVTVNNPASGGAGIIYG
jgi:hypothetical protein